MTMTSYGRLLLMVLIMGLFSAWPARSEGANSFVTLPGEARRAVDEIIAKIGGTPKIFSIRIQDDLVTLQVQGPNRETDVDEWRFVRTKLYLFNFERVSGPEAVRPADFVADAVAGFFDLETVALDKASALAEAAVKMAALEDPPRISAIEIARRITILPTPAFGEVYWTVTLVTGRETATVSADAGGTITSADLANTNRARRMNFINDDAWPKEQAIANLISAVGDKNVVRELTIYDKHMGITVDHPTAKEQTLDYSWDLSGVTTMGLLTPLFPGRGDGPLFSLRDVDLSALPAVKASVRSAWGNDKARIVYLMLKRDMEAAGKPELVWVVNLNDPNGETGWVRLGMDGTVRELDLPPSRKPKVDWMVPETVVGTIGRIGKELPQDTRYTQIMFQSDQATVLADDPLSPGTNAGFIIDAEKMSRSGMMMPWEAEIHPETTFSMRDITFFTPDKLRELLATTYKRLNITPEKMPLSRYTFSVGQLMTPDGSFMVPSRDGKVTLEIRVEAANRMDSGWVTFTSTGAELDVMTP